jgi:hypothetical protein
MTLLAIVVATIPLLIVVGLLRLADRVQRGREARLARQIELTDAIHREMGAVAAPMVEKRRGGGWLVRVMVPFDRPAVVAAILQITDRVFASSDGRESLQVVLTPRPVAVPTLAGVPQGARSRQVQSPASMIAVVR